MKKLLYFIPMLTILLVACGEGGSMGAGKAQPMNSQVDSISYAFGVSISQSLVRLKEDTGGEIEINQALLNNGIQEGVAGNQRLTEEDIKATMMQLNTLVETAQRQKQEVDGAANLGIGKTFLAENGIKEGVKTTASGLQYKVIKAGTGASPTPTDKVTVHYTGKLIDGTVFDSSVERGEPTSFGVGQVIPGWTEGLQLMKTGAKYEFYIPSELAYGLRGTPARGPSPGIPGNSVLIFEVELISVDK